MAVPFSLAVRAPVIWNEGVEWGLFPSLHSLAVMELCSYTFGL